MERPVGEVDGRISADVAIVVTAPLTEPKLAGLGWIVVSMKLAVVNLPAVLALADVVSSAAVDMAASVGGDLYPTACSLDDAGRFCTFVWFFSLLWKQIFLQSNHLNQTKLIKSRFLSVQTGQFYWVLAILG